MIQRTGRDAAARVVALAAVLVAGCAAGPGNADPCAGEGFVDDGLLPAPAALDGDARELAGLRHEAHPGCEQVTLVLAGAPGRPAVSAGRVRADILRELGVVRVSLPEVHRVGAEAIGTAFNGPLARAAYVVRSADGRWLFTDIHLAAAAEARVRTREAPGRVIIDLRPGGAPIPAPAAASTRLIVLTPRGAEASYPLTVTGYARTFEANVVIRLERDGSDAVETFTIATDRVDAWGSDSMTIEDGPRGTVTLHAGEYSARDGTWEGVAIDLALQ